MKKFLVIITTILIAGAAGYYIFNRDNFSRYSFPEFGQKNIALSDFFREVGSGKSTDGILSQVDLMINGEDGLLEKVADKVESAAEKIVGDFKFETFQKIKSAVNDKIDDMGNSVGISVGVGKIREAGKTDPVAFSVKSGTPAYFTLANRDNDKLDYEADWRDGNKDAGTIKIGDKKALSHNWAKAGEYLIQFKITTNGEEKNYQFLISIF